MPVDRAKLVQEQRQFYRNNFRRLLTTALVLTILIAILIAYIGYQQFARQPVNYFAATSDGRLIEITPAAQ